MRFLIGLAVLLCSTPALANERHFTFTYETAVLPPGGREFEVWMTPRVGRDQFYTRLEQRLEFEVGLTDRLMTALYLNGKTIAQVNSLGEVGVSTEWGSISSEWKYKLLDPAADVLGLALYGEVTGAADELEVEAKVLFDKRLGNVLLAANLVTEYEWGFGATEVSGELGLEVDLGVAYFLVPNLSVGLELRHTNELEEGELRHSGLFLGPTVAYSQDRWWVALSVMPQLPNFLQPTGSSVDLTGYERVHGRLLFSYHL